MKEVYQKIWDLALPYQDKRDDKGHGKTVLDFAWQLIKAENGDERVIVPAIILHDIGWSQISKRKRFLIFGDRLTKTAKIKVQKEHERIGAKMATEILDQVDYDPRLSEEIKEIVSGHDTRKGFLSKNDGLTRDADKLWRYSEKGLKIDIKRNNFSAQKLYQRLRRHIKESGFFYSARAKEIAQEELRERRREYKGTK